MYQIRIVKIYLQKNGSSMICYVYSLPAIRIPHHVASGGRVTLEVQVFNAETDFWVAPGTKASFETTS